MTQLNITGTPAVGETLTAVVDPATSGTFAWTGAAASATDTYVVQQADAGQQVRVDFTYAGPNGNPRTVDARINIPNDDTGRPDFNLDARRVKAGDVMAPRQDGRWQNVQALDGFAASAKTYIWLRDGTAISGAATDNYTVTAADEGSTMQLRIEYVDSSGNPQSVVSRAVD